MGAEEGGALRTDLREAGDDWRGVVGTSLLCSLPGKLEESFAGFPVGEGVEEVLLGGVLNGEGPAFEVCGTLPALLRRLAGLHSGRQGGGIGGGEEGLFGGGEDLGDEGGGEGGGLFVQLLEAGLVGFVEVGAGVNEAIVGDFEEAQGFGGRG